MFFTYMTSHINKYLNKSMNKCNTINFMYFIFQNHYHYSRSQYELHYKTIQKCVPLARVTRFEFNASNLQNEHLIIYLIIYHFSLNNVWKDIRKITLVSSHKFKLLRSYFVFYFFTAPFINR